jgi:S1-C subfamily serine protease
MTISRSDRPYGSFPGGRPETPPEAPPSTTARPRFRQRLWRAAVTPLAIASLALLSWTLVSAVDTGARHALRNEQEQPSAAPTLPLATAVYQQVAPAVVQVTATITAGETNFGSGVIVDDQADILTSLHVVNGARAVRVTFADGTQSAAQIVAKLPEKDIAVLRALQPPQVFPVAVLGNPNLLHIGDPAFAVGSPFNLPGSLSAGVISGLDRTVNGPGLQQPITGLIQFDAAVNQGSSGGPLVDQHGEVVGIVTGLVNPTGKVFSGVGFAVTIDQAGGALGIPPD